jgi:hypothetical protein
VRSANPDHPSFRAWLASAYALKGDSDHAATELAEARRLSGDDRYTSFARYRAVVGAAPGVPKVRALYEATYFAGLRKAGMPEERALGRPDHPRARRITGIAAE